MSTKTTIFLTRDNEHCYSDCSERRLKNNEHIGDDIIMEFDKSNITIIEDDRCDLIIQIKAGTELHKLISSIKQP